MSMHSTSCSKEKVVLKSKDFQTCAFCPDLCLDRCPVSLVTGRITLSPYGKMSLGFLLKRKMIEPTEDVIRSFYQCTGCLSCFEVCKHQVEVGNILFKMREEMVNEGRVIYDKALFIEDESLLSTILEDCAPQTLKVPEASAMVFPGCVTLKENTIILTDLFNVFSGLNIEFVGVSNELAVCCGYPLYVAGFIKDFCEKAMSVASKLQRYKMIVTPCARCAYTLKTLYPIVGVSISPRIVYALELIAPLVLREQRDHLEMKVVWHGSCFLSSHLGIKDLPKQTISHVMGSPPLEICEPSCCGAGGGWEKTSPKWAKMAGKTIARIAKESGGDILVTGSSSCSIHMKDNGYIQVMDIISLVSKWLRESKT